MSVLQLCKEASHVSNVSYGKALRSTEKGRGQCVRRLALLPHNKSQLLAASKCDLSLHLQQLLFHFLLAPNGITLGLPVIIHCPPTAPYPTNHCRSAVIGNGGGYFWLLQTSKVQLGARLWERATRTTAPVR